MKLLILSTFLIGLTINCACAKETITLDLRTDPSQRVHVITLSATDEGDYGHSYVTFDDENDKRQLSTHASVGFYPVSASDNVELGTQKLSVLFNLKGKLLDDSRTKTTYIVKIKIDEDKMAKARTVFDDWKGRDLYYPLISDCTTFVGEMASAAGLKTPNRMLYPYPIQYVKKIVALDTPDRNERYRKRAEERDRAAKEARARAADAHRRAARARHLQRLMEARAALSALSSAADALEQDELADNYERAAGNYDKKEVALNQKADHAEAQARSYRAQIVSPDIVLVDP